MSNVAILLAAGKSKRFKRKGAKQFLLLEKRYLIAYPLEVFLSSSYVQHIILVVPRGWIRFVKEKVLKKYNSKGKKIQVIVGGKRRQDSAYLALKKVPPEAQFVLIHDGARPFITQRMIASSVKEAERCGACIFALPPTNTIKESRDGKIVEKTLSRNKLWKVQTPQTFHYDLIKKAFASAYRRNWYGTDTSSLVERIGGKVKILLGNKRNIKITTPQDLIFAKVLLKNGNRHRVRHS